MLTLYKSFTISRTPPPPKSPGTRPNPESGQAIWDHAVCTLTCTLSCTLTKTSDSMVLRLELQTMPVSVSTGGTLRRKISKVVDPRDARLAKREN